MKVVILAGGFGTRISEESYLKPKPMIEIVERPILWHIMKIYSHYGFNDFIVCLGYKGYYIKEYFAHYFLHESDTTFDFSNGNQQIIHNQSVEPWRVTLVNTGLQTKTGGRIKKVQQYIGDETFMMTYGDGVADINIRDLLNFHRSHGNLATITAAQPVGRFGSLNLSEDNIVNVFKEKPKGDLTWVNAGFFVLEPKVFDYIGDNDTFFEKEPLENLSRDKELVAYKHFGFWHPMDTLRDKDLLESLWQSGKHPGKYGNKSHTGRYRVIDRNFWKRKKIFVTGHTGFKGSWLCLWLQSLGAEVIGYALNPPTNPNLFELCEIDKLITSSIADIRDINSLTKAIHSSQPEIIIHMAAQPLVRESYKNPVETYSVNVMGTVNLLEAVRNSKGIKAVINITTDKCYENKEWCWGYRENEPLGGDDTYSNSKACSELVTSAYRNSFFNTQHYNIHGVGLASARAGNVIGGGDWAVDRLVPDCIRALLAGEKIIVRNPKSIRPWQHVLEPLSGYLLLAQKLFENGPTYAEGWNFGPDDSDAKPVECIVKAMCNQWGKNASYKIDKGEHPHEAHYLKLDCSKAKSELGWYPRWNLEKAIDKVIEWTRAYSEKKNVRKVCLKQIKEYSNR